MAERLKKLFAKRKDKFKNAGPGHSLRETSSTSSASSAKSQKETASYPKERVEPSQEAKQAAAAALARLNPPARTAGFNTSLAAIQAQVKRELEAEKKANATVEVSHKPKVEVQEMEASPHLAVTGVYFTCPIVGGGTFTKEEWMKRIRDFLHEELENEPGLIACLMIHTLNRNKEKVASCVEILCKYLENVVKNPTEEKYRKIRMSNKIFQEKVVNLEGTKEFLAAAGFQEQLLPFQDKEEPFLVMSESKLEDLESLQVLIDALQSAEPIGLELDRNLQVLLPSQAARRHELPASFFSLSPEELKREQQAKQELAELQTSLRTKAMREKDELREMRKYKFCLIRVRFPDGVLLQGTFGVYEKFGQVVEFVRDNLISEDALFSLQMLTGQTFTQEDNEKTLIELHLVPATVIVFAWKGSAPASDAGSAFLKPEVMVLMQKV
ncbi:unnamed protein product [Bemisia tabaci]|uniref:UBX domain-containing protein n=1 Tax=Bemisia tabaci TaxID=7038 RepID=A0AAI8UTZ4_BEMTA|nr:unnamed protein product [Bemisia tabaci]